MKISNQMTKNELQEEGKSFADNSTELFKNLTSELHFHFEKFLNKHKNERENIINCLSNSIKVK